MKCLSPHRSRRIKGAVGSGLLVLSWLGGFTFTSGYLGWVRIEGEKDWQNVQAEMKAAGYSLDPAEIASPAIPDGENLGAIPALHGLAAPEKKQSPEARAAAAALLALDPVRLPAPDPSGRRAPIPQEEAPQDWEAWRAWLSGPRGWKVPAKKDPAAAVLATLRQHDATGLIPAFLQAASQHPGTQLIPRQKDRVTGSGGTPQGSSSEEYSLVPLIALNRHLLLRMDAALACGDNKEAASLVHAVTALEKLTASDAGLSNLMMASGIEMTLRFSVTRALNRRKMDDRTLQSCQEWFTAHSTSPPLLKAFEMENAMLVRALETPGGLDALFGPNSGIQTKWWPFLFPFIGPANRATLCRNFLADAPLLKAADWPAFLRLQAARLERIKSTPKDWKFLFEAGRIVANGTDSTAIVQRLARLEMHGRAMATACAIERHRLKTGALPDSLSAISRELLPAPLPDLDGKPLRYQKNKSGWILWSVGLNLLDDRQGNTTPAAQNINPKSVNAPDWEWSFDAM